MPTHYYAHLRTVHPHTAQARGFFRLEGARSGRIWEVLCAAGWLKDNNPEEAEDKRRTHRAKKEALVQQQNMQQAAAASLAVGFPPSSGVAKPMSAAVAAAAAAAVLGLPAPSGATGVSESGGEGLVSEATGTTASGVVAEDMDDDDDDFKP
jgi:hypothetical protein